MKKKAGLTLILTILCFLMSAFPAMAGEWHKTAEDQYQYIKDDGTKATGLLELKDGTYYLDDKGNRKPPTGCATKATGILRRDGSDGHRHLGR